MAWASAESIAHASIFDPAYRFRTRSTDHFIVYFHQGEESLAARLADIAEETWRNFTVRLGTARPGLTHVVLADQTELPNGLATPLPYNTILISPVWPGGVDPIGLTDDWLRLVFTHEFTHILHLDRSEGWARAARGIFGRIPVAFPNLFLPMWQTEGIATYEESAMTGGGRLHAGEFRAIVDEAVRARRLEPLDRVNGGLTDWPGGSGAYAYGLEFHKYLVDRYGTASLAQLSDATAGRVPFTAAPMFKRVYGRSLGALWREYEDSLADQGDTEPSIQPTASPHSERLDVGAATRLTHHGFIVTGPRFVIDGGCNSCPARVAYSTQNPHEFPAMYELAPGASTPRRLISRYLGATAAAGRDTIYFNQLEIRRNSGLYSDLFALDRRTGRVRQLTSEARLLDPDLSPDQSTLVCVRDAPGRRDLTLVKLAGHDIEANTPRITTLISEPDTHFNAPRWSPDGRTIVVERHIQGRLSEIVIVNPATQGVRTIAALPDSRFVTPTWRPDGFAVVAAGSLGEATFDLFEIPVNPAAAFAATESVLPPLRRLTHVHGGATWPDISPDGRKLVFVGYTTDGYDLFEMPYPPDVPSSDAVFGFSRTDKSDVVSGFGPTVAPSAPYRPWQTLKPTSWSPIVEADANQLRFGFATAAVDVLGYHSYELSATWLARSPEGASTPEAARPDWQASYQYARWRPTFWFAASDRTSFFAGPADDRGVPSTATLRERQLEGGVLFPIRHVRVSQTMIASLVRSADDFMLAQGVVSRTHTAWRAGWEINSARTYGYSISPENGVVVGVTTDFASEALGSSADARTVTADARVYLTPFRPHHVLALRTAGGASSGDPTVARTFHLGGAQSNAQTLDFGRDAISLLRGFASDTFAGSHVALLNADYRWPLARPQRGHGTMPLFFHTVHAAAFVDVGHAWNSSFNARDLKSSVGSELSFDLVAGYSFRLTASVGAAWGRDGSRTVPDGGSVYVRIGRAF
jgi:hypothetical protein